MYGTGSNSLIAEQATLKEFVVSSSFPQEKCAQKIK